MSTILLLLLGHPVGDDVNAGFGAIHLPVATNKELSRLEEGVTGNRFISMVFSDCYKDVMWLNNLGSNIHLNIFSLDQVTSYTWTGI